MKKRSIDIFAQWHEDDKIWVATSPDLPGLVTEARDFEKLRRRLALIIPDFLASLAEEGKGLPPHIQGFDIKQSLYS
jgi:predicted RNase H-like HicB family nuclease